MGVMMTMTSMYYIQSYVNIHKMDKNHQSYFMALPFCFMLLTLILNILYRQQLYMMGEEFILILQSNSNLIIDWFFLLVTMTIDPTIIVLISILILVYSKKKQKAITIFIFILLNTFLAATLKAFYTDPRPIWSSEQIRSIGIYCPIQYGNPSGHSWFSVVLGFGILLEYKGLGQNYKNLLIAISFMIFVPFSRMYLGAHSLNQVIQGITYGLVMCLAFKIHLKEFILKFLWNFHLNNRLKFIILSCHLLYLIPFLIDLGQELPENWEKNISDKCHTILNQSQLNFLMFTVNGILVNIITGISAAYHHILDDENGTLYLLGQWQINQQRYELNRGKIYVISIQIGLIISGLGICGLISFFIKDIKFLFFITVNFGGLISGYLYIRYSCSLLFKWRIIENINHQLF